MIARGNHYFDRNKTLSLCSRVRATSDSANNNYFIEEAMSLKGVIGAETVGLANCGNAGGCGLSLIG